MKILSTLPHCEGQWAVGLLQGVVWCGVVWCGVVWCGVVWCGVVWCGVVWCGVVLYETGLSAATPHCIVPRKMKPGD